MNSRSSIDPLRACLLGLVLTLVPATCRAAPDQLPDGFLEAMMEKQEVGVADEILEAEKRAIILLTRTGRLFKLLKSWENYQASKKPVPPPTSVVTRSFLRRVRDLAVRFHSQSPASTPVDPVLARQKEKGSDIWEVVLQTRRNGVEKRTRKIVVEVDVKRWVAGKKGSLSAQA